MPHIHGNKIQLSLYLEPDVYFALEASRNPKVPRAEHITNILKTSAGIV